MRFITMHLLGFLALVLRVGTNEPSREDATTREDTTLVVTATSVKSGFYNSSTAFENTSKQFITGTAAIFQTSTLSVIDYNSSGSAFSRTSEQFTKETEILFQTSTISVMDTGSMSKNMYYDFKRASIYIQFILAICAVFANVCNLAVFSNKRMRSSTSTILAFLSCSELGVAVVELIMASSTVMLYSSIYTSYVFWTLFRWSRGYLNVVFQRSCLCFNVFVAVERFIAVRFPLKAKLILSRTRPSVICVAISVMISGSHIFNPLKMEVRPVNTRYGAIYLIQDSLLYTNNYDTFGVLSILTKIIFSYIPLIGCFFINILMVTALWKHRKQMKQIQVNLNPQQQQKQNRQTQKTITILVSTFFFVLFSLPDAAITIIESTNPEYGALNFKSEHYIYRFMVLFGGQLYLLNLSMEFLVYMVLSVAYRQTVFSWFSTTYRRRRGRSDIRTASMTSLALSRSMTMSTRRTLNSGTTQATRDDINTVDGAAMISDGSVFRVRM